MKKRGIEMPGEKKGLSTVVAIILIILISLIAIALLWVFVKNYIHKSNLEESQGFLNCIQESNIQIILACYEGNLLKITVKNKADLILGDFLLIDITYKEGYSELIPTPYNTYIGSYETKTITIPYTKEIEKIKLIPRIEKQVYACQENSPEYSNINPC